MTADAIQIIAFLFGPIFRLFTFRIPGTYATPLSWAFLSLALVAVLRMIKLYFMGGGPDND